MNLQHDVLYIGQYSTSSSHVRSIRTVNKFLDFTSNGQWMSHVKFLDVWPWLNFLQGSFSVNQIITSTPKAPRQQFIDVEEFSTVFATPAVNDKTQSGNLFSSIFCVIENTTKKTTNKQNYNYIYTCYDVYIMFSET